MYQSSFGFANPTKSDVVLCFLYFNLIAILTYNVTTVKPKVFGARL